jgi:hypothetical protein
MNQETFVSMVARWKETPDADEWAAIQKLAKDLTVQNVIHVIEGDAVTISASFGNESLNHDMLLPVIPASRSDSRQCSPH